MLYEILFIAVLFMNFFPLDGLRQDSFMNNVFALWFHILMFLVYIPVWIRIPQVITWETLGGVGFVINIASLLGHIIAYTIDN